MEKGVITIKEYLLSTNNFSTPTVLKDRDCHAMLILRLLLLEPGSMTDYPEMGVGIVSRYLFSDTGELENLKLDIQKQISTYLPELVGVEVTITNSKLGEIQIQIIEDGTLYSFETDTTNKTIKIVDL